MNLESSYHFYVEGSYSIWYHQHTVGDMTYRFNKSHHQKIGCDSDPSQISVHQLMLIDLTSRIRARTPIHWTSAAEEWVVFLDSIDTKWSTMPRCKMELFLSPLLSKGAFQWTWNLRTIFMSRVAIQFGIINILLVIWYIKLTSPTTKRLSKTPTHHKLVCTNLC